MNRDIPSRPATKHLAIAGVIALLLGFTAACAPPPSDPIVGNWNITYGAPAVVSIALVGDTYTMTAQTPVVVVGATCSLPVGTVLATFTGTGGSYTGQHGLWYTNNCAFAYNTSATLTQNSDGTLSLKIGAFAPYIMTKA